MSEPKTAEPPATETAAAEPAATPPAESPLSKYMNSLKVVPAENPPPGEAAAKPEVVKGSQDAPKEGDSDPIGDFMGGEEKEKETPGKEEEAPAVAEKETPADDLPSPKTAEDWATAKETFRRKVEAEYDNRLTDLQAKLDARTKEYEEATSELSKYSLAKSPAYKQQFTEPKREAVAAVERLGGDSEEVKKLSAAMRAGNLRVEDVPNLDSLGEFQKRRIYELADKWIQVDEAEQVALDNHEQSQKELEIQDFELEQQRNKVYQQQIANQLHHATSKALTEASQRLPGFGEAHAQKVMEQVGSGDVMANASRAMAVTAWAQTEFPKFAASRDKAMADLKAAEEKIAALEKRLGGADDLNKITSGSSDTPASGGTPANPLGTFIDGIRAKAARG